MKYAALLQQGLDEKKQQVTNFVCQNEKIARLAQLEEEISSMNLGYFELAENISKDITADLLKSKIEL